ncbi:Periplasmic component of the Tol biopolymer transport system [Methanosarcina horonobensis HB-1 = JCM 15518]|uniref:Periplasmic component of the Tol biopolymer transport system n=1 Tax=Methanosarcina horonobensis HB-1 = JCM 15518 TaxID=1434110 RepID=A0A0E3SEI3_9EURY|nr:Periplasmic component of the Tol biopolymer transport system [Methanosarcina horonobensis HB-1 = JCM 15518]
MPVKEIIGNEESNTVDQVQSNEFNFTKMSNTAENKEKSRKSPSFVFLQLFVCLIGIWFLHKSREQGYCE